MKRYSRIITGAVVAPLVMALSGCVMTVDQLYCPPRRSESFNNLQSAMDAAMQGMVFSAPISGDNQQPVQMMDLDGDSIEEAIVFAKGTQENPLHIMVFAREGNEYHLSSTIESTGSAFEQVDYVQLDEEPGLEMIVGRQVQNQVLRNFSVYSFAHGSPDKLLTANYQKYITCDMNDDPYKEIVAMNPGHTEAEPGMVCVYWMKQGKLEQTPEIPLSQPLAHVKRIMPGTLSDGSHAFLVSSTVDENTLVTDVFSMVDGTLSNVTPSDRAGTRVSNLNDHHVFPDDIDQDEVLELPQVISGNGFESQQQEPMIRWYALDQQGNEQTKAYTYHNFQEGWYLELDLQTAPRLSVIPESNGQYGFYITDDASEEREKLWTIYMLTGEERSAQAAENHRFVLAKTDSVVYAGELEDKARLAGVNEDHLKAVFHLIQSDWKTGEM